MHQRFEPGMGSLGSTKPKFLHAGDFPMITRSVTIKQGQKLSYGSVLGRLDDDGEYVLCKKTTVPEATEENPNPEPVEVTDGSQIPQGVLTEDVDASHEDKKAVIYLSGQFNYNAMHFGDGFTNEDGTPTREMVDKLRFISIFMEKGVKAHPRT